MKHLLPKKILGFTLIKTLNKNINHRSFSYGHYRNQKGLDVFAKIWKNKNKNFDYKSLLNEKKLYELLSKLNKDVFIKNKIYTPLYFGWEEHSNFAALFIQMLKGHTAERLPAKVQYQKITQVKAFVKKISPLLLSKAGSELKNRDHKLLLLGFPIFFLKIQNNPYIKKNILKILWRYLNSSSLFLDNFPKVLAHKSIEPKNIIISGSRTYLIDFQLTVVSNEVLDIVETLFFNWTNVGLKKLIINGKEFKRYCKNEKYGKLLRFLLIYCGVHQLSEGVVDPKIAIDFLNFSLKI